MKRTDTLFPDTTLVRTPGMPMATGRLWAISVDSIARIDGAWTSRTPTSIASPGARVRLVGAFHCSPASFHSRSARAAEWTEIGRAHVCTPVTTAHLVCRLLLDTKISTLTSHKCHP